MFLGPNKNTIQVQKFDRVQIKRLFMFFLASQDDWLTRWLTEGTDWDFTDVTLVSEDT